MHSARARTAHILWSTVRAVALLLALAAPVLATVDADNPEGMIVAPKQQKGGVGFVLLMSLQRA